MSRIDEAPSSRPTTAPGDAEGDLIFMGIAACVLAVFLTFNALNVAQEHAASGHPLRFWEPIVWEASSGIYFLSVSPAILAAARRLWLLAPPRAINLALHFLVAVLISLGHVLTIGAVRWSAYRLLGGHYGPFWPLENWPYEFRKDLLVYASVVAIYMAWRQLRALPRTPDPSGDVLEVRDGARRHFVPLSEVVWVEAAGNYVELHRGAGGVLHRASLSAMERRLEHAGFVRIHRSRLVRREAIAGVESKPTGDFTVRLRDGRELAGSRRYRRPLLAD